MKNTKKSKSRTTNQIEMELLGAMLLNSETVRDVYQSPFNEADLTNQVHRNIYNSLVMTAIVCEDSASDPIAVGRDLLERGLLDECGGHGYLLDLLESVVTSANAEADARELVSRKRRIANAGTSA